MLIQASLVASQGLDWSLLKTSSLPRSPADCPVTPCLSLQSKVPGCSGATGLQATCNHGW